jgi:hypothetical protein
MSAADHRNGDRLELGVVRCYRDLLKAMRAQVANLNINYATLDDLAGYTSTYSTKILAELPARHFTPQSLDAYLGALCIDLIAVHNPEKFAKLQEKYGNKLEQRQSPSLKPKRMRGNTVVIRFSQRRLKNMQRKGGRNSRKYLTPEAASELGKRASMARWHASESVEVGNAPHREAGPHG